MEHIEYVEQRNGGFYVAVHVSPWTPFCIVSELETSRKRSPRTSLLSLEQVYGAITFYLAHAQEFDANIREGEEEMDRSVPPLSGSRPGLYALLELGRHQIASEDLAKH